MKRSKLTCLIGMIVAFFYCEKNLLAQDRETKVQNDRKLALDEGYWIYNDFNAAREVAKKSGKPMLVTFRCIPCEACAQLDSEVMQRDKTVQQWLDKFVCVRIVHANGMDLSQFQFDFDQSWSAFMLNADGTIYGRYGTRSHQTQSEADMSIEGFAEALKAASAIHNAYPTGRDQFLAKKGTAPPVSAPEAFPSFKSKFAAELDYEGKVVASCIHCHQVGQAYRLWYRDAMKPIPLDVLYPYPHPKILGLIMDPKKRSSVISVTPGSVAEKDGLRAGDSIATMAGQPILSIADMQWVLDRAGDVNSIPVQLLRDDQSVAIKLSLPAGWRETGDISWRASSWDLRRMVTGGLVLDSPSPDELKLLGRSAEQLNLRVKHVGQYNEHAAAKNAGFQVGDIVIKVDTKSQAMTDSQLMAWMVNNFKRGDQIKVQVLRGSKQIELALPIQ